MDVPTHATRRIERYGVLALILFLTTFGVLYLWDDEDSTEPAKYPQMNQVAAGYHPRSTERPTRPEGTRDTQTDGGARSKSLPLSEMHPEQDDLRRMASERRDERVDGSATVERDHLLDDDQRNSGLANYFMDYPSPKGPVSDVTVSEYSGRRQRPVEEESAAWAHAGSEMEYIVKSGDCLSEIAQRELGSVRHLARLREVNGLTSDSLRVGQRLILPHIGETAPVRGTDIKMTPARMLQQREEETAADAPAGSETEYVVKSGDCLSEIAQRELGSMRHLERLREVNGLTSDSLRVGQRLILPHIGETAPVRGMDLERSSALAADTREWEIVVVKEGDNLWTIAARELGDGERYDEIMQWNDLRSDMLRLGTKLRIKRPSGDALAMGDQAR